MNKIKIHGLLARSFGDEMYLKLGCLQNIFDAIDANKPGFIAKVNKLSKMGFNYAIIADGKVIKSLKDFRETKNMKVIELVPVICGSGAVAAAVSIIGSVVSTAVAAVGAVFGAISAGIGAIGSAIAAGGGWASFAMFVVGTGLSLLLAPSPDFDDPKAQSQSTKGLQSSFAFSNKTNVASQGAPIPFGYGRLRVGSQVVQASLKTFPQNIRASEAMVKNPYNEAGDYSQSDTEIAPLL